MKPVVQQEVTGCAIVRPAAIAGISYEEAEAKAVADGMGIYAEDSDWWSETHVIRKLLARLGVPTISKEMPFTGWDSLPDCALLSIKWRLEKGTPVWHWGVFVRQGGRNYVLDSQNALKTNIRTDFGRMKPKWFIEVNGTTEEGGTYDIGSEQVADSP